MKLISYTDLDDQTQYVDVTKVMYTESFKYGEPDPDNHNLPSKLATRICLATAVGGYVIAKETSEVIWDRIHKAHE